MSVSFRSNVPRETVKSEEPCMCSQQAPGWCDWITNRIRNEIARETIRRYASHECGFCNGTGFEITIKDNCPNFSSANAKALLGAFGFDRIGCVSIDKARRGIIRARNINLEKYCFEGEIVFGSPMQQDNGTIAMRPIRSASGGLDVNGLKDRVEFLATWIEEEIKAGATSIWWE